jgi:hypothetical protein
MNHSAFCALACFAVVLAAVALAQPDPNFLDHDRTRPQPPTVTPGAQPGQAPSDAIVLYDGKDLSQWCAMDGTPTKWVNRDGHMECVPGSGYIRTLRNFGDCQLHVEWATPAPGRGEGQGRGNSGVFFGLDRYEVQVLDSYNSPTYADGLAAAIYGQYPPLVNASLPPGVWQTYDIIYTAPRFEADGKLRSPVYETVLHNGVLVQNHVQLTGPTSWLERAPYQAHPEKQPISLQDHGNPVRFRNIWIRELNNPGRAEFTYSDVVLDVCVGDYDAGGENTITVKRQGSQLVVSLFGSTFTMFAGSETHFFAKTTDLQLDFQKEASGKVTSVIWSVGEGKNTAKKIR